MIAFEKSIGVVLFRINKEKIKYLLLHYPGGHWDFPKGHCEKNENDHETLRRELNEETGITDLKIIPGFKSQIRYFYLAKNKEKEQRKKEGKDTAIFKKVIYYLASTNTNQVYLSAEHISFNWLNYDEASKKITYKNSRKVLIEAQRFLEENK